MDIVKDPQDPTKHYPSSSKTSLIQTLYLHIRTLTAGNFRPDDKPQFLPATALSIPLDSPIRRDPCMG